MPPKKARRSAKDPVLRGERVRKLREDRGWTQMELAIRLKTTPSGVSQIENGYRDVTAAKVVELVHALGLDSADYLLGLKDRP